MFVVVVPVLRRFLESLAPIVSVNQTSPFRPELLDAFLLYAGAYVHQTGRLREWYATTIYYQAAVQKGAAADGWRRIRYLHLQTRQRFHQYYYR